MKALIGRLPVVGSAARKVYKMLTRNKRHKKHAFAGSQSYWEGRYAHQGTSGAGSYGKLAEFKAEVLNEFVAEHHINSVIELGCGDGNQLKLARYPKYSGFDVSDTAIRVCRETFAGDPTKAFRVMADYSGERADLAMSLDVIYHLVEDGVFDSYMRTLFNASHRFVAIYSSNKEEPGSGASAHVRHRQFDRWIAKNAGSWALMKVLPNRYPFRGDLREGSFADFYFYSLTTGS